MSILDLRGHSNILILIDYKNQTISKANFLFYTDKKLSQILHIPKHYKLDHSVFVVALKKNSRKKNYGTSRICCKIKLFMFKYTIY